MKKDYTPLDFIAAFSGLFAAFSVAWILLGLFVALVLGILAASLFVTIFYSASRFCERRRTRFLNGREADCK